jgi:hypothetical protein
MTVHIESKAAAKAPGSPLKGRRLKVTPDQEAAIHRLKAEGQGVSAIAKSCGLSRPTVYSVLGSGPAAEAKPAPLEPKPLGEAASLPKEPTTTTTDIPAAAPSLGLPEATPDSTGTDRVAPLPAVMKIISGGQVGAQQAALRAARAVGVATGGYSARGWMTESGPAPWLAEFGLVECDGAGYAARSRANVAASDGTVWFGLWTNTPGALATLATCDALHRPCLRIDRDFHRPRDVAGWIVSRGIKRLNVAGTGETREPGLGACVEWFIRDVLRELAAVGALAGASGR